MRRTALAALTCALALPAGAQAATTGRLLVRLEPAAGTTGRAAASTLAEAGARQVGRGIPKLDTVAVRPTEGDGLKALAAELRARPGIAHVEQEQRAELRAVPDDPALTTPEPAGGAPAGTPVEWWAQRTGLFAAWDVPQTRDATVAVIDTGIDATHPEFANRIAAAVDNDPTEGRGPATVDENGHGTHVASLACAAADNGIGIAGAGYGCKLLIYKTDLSDESVALSITQAVDAGADAINMSFGTDGMVAPSETIRTALRYAYDRGVILVAAAADEVTEAQGYPADELQPTGTGSDLAAGLGLSVTAANAADQRATFAGLGSQISVAAYGAWNVGTDGPRGLLGAFPGTLTELDTGSITPPEDPCNCRTSFLGDNRYAYVQGTSMAAPIVAAVAAMVRHLNPDLTAAEVIRILKVTAHRPAGTAWEPNLGWGIVDAGAAVAAARLVDRVPPATRLTVAKPRSTTLTLRFRGKDGARPGIPATGIARYDVMRSLDGKSAVRIVRTRSRTVKVRVRRGHRYAFWTVATDGAGNREARPKTPDARIRLARR